MLAKLKQNQSQSSARVVDGKLILSFPHAHTPVVWQMDLAQTKASALEVLSAEDASMFTLSLKTPKGEKLDIAKFETREDAVDALMATSRALENAQGQITGTATQPQTAQASVKTNQSANDNAPGKWVAGALGVLMLAVLFGLWGLVAPTTPSSLQTGSISPAAQTNNAAASASGVPVSADEFLNGL